MGIRKSLSEIISKPLTEFVFISTIHSTEELNRLRRNKFWISMTPSILFLGMSKVERLQNYDKQISSELAALRAQRSESSNNGGERQHESEIAVIESAENPPRKSFGLATVRTTTWIFQDILRLFVANRIPAYFVTLRTMASRNALVLMYRGHSKGMMSDGSKLARITAAPAPDDIIWNNITVERRVIKIRRLFVRTMLLIIAIGFAYPITLLQTYAKEHISSANEDVYVGSLGFARYSLSMYPPSFKSY
jgi:hypothetical protein